MRILISDKLSPKCAEILRSAGHEVDEKTGLSPETLKGIIGKYHGLIVRSATKVTADLLAAADKLKVIGRAGTGVDNVDLAAAGARNIVVMNTPGGNSNAVAELALCQMLALGRDLYRAVHSLKEKRWEKKHFEGSEITGKTLRILGYGRVSRLLAGKCRALGMTVLCYDPKIAKTLCDSDGLEITDSLEMVLGKSDYLSVHLSKRKDTVNFLARPQFEQMKRGAFLVNLSRGGIVSEADLLWALEAGIIAGAALDVFVKEPPEDFSLIEHPQIICTPHIGAASAESQENVAVLIAEQFVDMFAGRGIHNQVNG